YGETYLVSAENEIKNIDVVRTIVNILGKDENLIKFVNDRPGHDKRYSLDPSKIKGELGWRPENKFAVGIEKQSNTM
ncbi:MAG: GDP-mannose 4,6-dehydratase, partial [Nitrososphaeria archaeon]